MTRWALHIALLLALVQSIHCAGQNLVPNPSFELYNRCPFGISGIEYSPGYVTFPTVQDWVNPTQVGSADYFNACAAASTTVSVPQNGFGYQPAKTGNGYVGLIAWDAEDQGGTIINKYAEYVQCKLTQPMVAGTNYCVTFYVSNGITNGSYNYVGIDAIGANFSNVKGTYPTGATVSLSYSMVNQPGNFLTDTTGWKMVSAVYTAAGGEEWMTIGWFNHGPTPAFIPVKPSAPQPQLPYRCYLFMDDVSVVPMTNVDTFYTSNDSTICTRTGLDVSLHSNAQLADYKWNNGVTTQTLNARDTGTYYCVARTGCITYIDTFRIRYAPAPELDLGKELVDCNSQPITILSNYPDDVSYIWNTGDTSDNITVSQGGTYYLTISNHCGTQTDSVHVYIQPPTPAPPSADTMICQFSTDAAIQVQGTGIKWYTHQQSRFGTEQQPPVIAYEPGTYNLFITQTVGKCESEMSPVNVEVTYTPHEELGDEITMCDNDLKKIGVYVEGVDYKWNTGSTACCILPERDGLYKLAATNQCGTFIDSLWVIHNSCEECIVFPNAFTPVTGSENRIFRPLLKCPVEEFNIRIYNRWGNLVYQSNDVRDGWRGRYNYEYAPMGTYVYMVEYRARDKKQTQYIQGNVTLLR